MHSKSSLGCTLGKTNFLHAIALGFPLPLLYKGPTSLSYLGFAGEDEQLPPRV